MSEELTAWPFREARSILEKLEREGDEERKHDYVLLETGFGPSGLPHIGTFSEVARTTWVRHAFEHLSDLPTRLFTFSDDMDGLRKVPQNIPNQDLILEHLGKPLCDIPDPFGEEESFSAYMNEKLKGFLDSFGFDYEFKSSKDQYRGGVFNEGLVQILRNYEEVRQVIIPTLREKNREDWSPFFPICQNCGKVYTTRVLDIHPEDDQISYVCDQSFRNIEPCEHNGRMAVTDGNVKVGWKVDWALRWYVFDVDYEMYGKDLIDPAELSAKIVRVLGGEPPAGFFYEMFLDENGQKISKSVGKGLTIDEWLDYGPLESLGWYIFQSPQKAKKLYFDVIPRSVDRYLEDRRDFGGAEGDERLDNPVWFVEHDKVEAGEEVGFEADISFSMLLNLVNVLNTDDREVVWEYVRRYDDNADQNEQIIDEMIERALRYYRDFVLPTKEFEAPADEMMPALKQFRDFLAGYEGDEAEEIQTACYSAGKDHDLSLGKWFRTLYRLMLGQDRGPRVGTFVSVYGVDDTVELIDRRLDELAGD
ncbi:MAG: lysine--tRNA ligase [Persicimonas sp.]